MDLLVRRNCWRNSPSYAYPSVQTNPTLRNSSISVATTVLWSWWVDEMKCGSWKSRTLGWSILSRTLLLGTRTLVLLSKIIVTFFNLIHFNLAIQDFIAWTDREPFYVFENDKKWKLGMSHPTTLKTVNISWYNKEQTINYNYKNMVTHMTCSLREWIWSIIINPAFSMAPSFKVMSIKMMD